MEAIDINRTNIVKDMEQERQTYKSRKTESTTLEIKTKRYRK